MQQEESKILKDNLNNESEEDDEEENIFEKEKKNVDDIIAWDIFYKHENTLLHYKVCIISHITGYYLIHCINIISNFAIF